MKLIDLHKVDGEWTKTIDKDGKVVGRLMVDYKTLDQMPAVYQDDNVESVVHCAQCKKRKLNSCRRIYIEEHYGIVDETDDWGYCDRGELET